MADNRFHFQIPLENISTEKINKHGGGRNYKRDDYTAHGQKLWQDAAAVRIVETRRKDFDLVSNLFLQIETPPLVPIKYHKIKIEHLGFELISFSGANSSLGIVKISKAKFQDLDEKLTEYIQSPTNTGKTYFSVIENLSSISVEAKLLDIESAKNNNAGFQIIFNLYNSIRVKEKFAVNQILLQELKKYDSEVFEQSFANGTTSVSCNLKFEDILKVADQYSSIRDVRINHVAHAENAIATYPIPGRLSIKKPKSNSSICVIDSGVSNPNGIFDGILVNSIPHLPSGAVEAHFEHGTFVASRCTFGDNIDSCLGNLSLEPYCKIIDVQTFGIDSKGQRVNPTDFHLRRIIEEVIIKLHKNVKVYNLSFGFVNSIKDGEFSETAKLLDYLSKKYKVLFVVASGNIKELLGAYPDLHFGNPLARIGSPAESLLSITVGALAKNEGINSLAKRDQLAPFSKVGPGADLGLKPELTAHGGNLITKYNRVPDIATYGICPDGKRIAVNVGTSFATPLISQYAQRLFDAYPDSDPNLIKALLYHFSSDREHPCLVKNGNNNYTGFGEPTPELATSASPHSAAFIFEGKLDSNDYQYVGFHIPKSLAAENKNSRLELRITLVFDPSVAPDNHAEYSQARIAMSLRKPTKNGASFIGVSGMSNYHIPWNPIIRFRKTFTRNYLTGSWDVELRLFTRGKISTKYQQDYALVIEIIDKKKGTDVHEDLKAEYGNIYKRIKIKSAA